MVDVASELFMLKEDLGATTQGHSACFEEDLSHLLRMGRGRCCLIESLCGYSGKSPRMMQY